MCLRRSASDRRRLGNRRIYSKGSHAVARAFVVVPSDRDDQRRPERAAEYTSPAHRCGSISSLRIRPQSPFPSNARAETDFSRRMGYVPAVDQTSLLYLSLTRCCAAQRLYTTGPRGTTAKRDPKRDLSRLGRAPKCEISHLGTRTQLFAPAPHRGNPGVRRDGPRHGPPLSRQPLWGASATAPGLPFHATDAGSRLGFQRYTRFSRVLTQAPIGHRSSTAALN